MTTGAAELKSAVRHAGLALWGWQTANLRPGGYESPARPLRQVPELRQVECVAGAPAR
jgi:hypothetical protein